MQIVPRTAEDWNLYYQDSFLKAQIDGKWRWVYARSFDRALTDDGTAVSNNHVTMFFSFDRDTERANRTLRLNLNPPYNFDLSFPDCHYYFLDGHAKLLTRIALRQNKKTLDRNNHRWFDPLEEIVPPNFQGIINANSDVIKRLDANLSDFTLKQAIRMTTEERAFTVPMKQEWCLSLSPTDKYSHLLWYRRVAVAYIDDKTQTAHIITEPYRQEVIDNFGSELQIQ